jgi:hypothetical protein
MDPTELLRPEGVHLGEAVFALLEPDPLPGLETTELRHRLTVLLTATGSGEVGPGSAHRRQSGR